MNEKVFPALKRLYDGFGSGHERRKLKRQITEFENEFNINETPREAVAAVSCQMQRNDGNPPQNDGLHCIDCAFNWCKQCPERKLHKLMEDLIKEDDLPFNTFHTHESVKSGTIHGSLPGNQKACTICDEKREGEEQGNITPKCQPVCTTLPFNDFFRSII